MSDIKIVNDDTKFDADVKFGSKGTSNRFTMQYSSQEFNATDEVAEVLKCCFGCS